MDKVVFCLCLWSYLLLCAHDTSELGLRAVVVVCSLALFALEFTIGRVRFGDYYRAKFAPPSDAKSPALRAVSEGKLKQKFESVGPAFTPWTLPDPALPEVRTHVPILHFVSACSSRSSPLPAAPAPSCARGARARSDLDLSSTSVSARALGIEELLVTLAEGLPVAP